MNATTWQTISVVAGLLFGVVTTFFLVRSNIRESIRQREADQERVVREAKAPLVADNERLSAELAAAKVRVTQLEDWLYAGRTGDKRD